MSNWADSQQFHQDKRFTVEANGGTVPKVKLLSMTADPLGAIAALASMYEGKVIRSLDDLTDDDRRKAFANTQQTHLQAPLEAVKLHFLIEGVDRAFTHQLVRQRTAVYAQESLRFAVVDDLENATTLPPSLHGTIPRNTPGAVTAMPDQKQAWRNLWDQAIGTIDSTYRYLVDDGMPAEEARGLLPHATATRMPATDCALRLSSTGVRCSIRSLRRSGASTLRNLTAGSSKPLPTATCSSRFATSLASARSLPASTEPAPSATECRSSTRKAYLRPTGT